MTRDEMKEKVARAIYKHQREFNEKPSDDFDCRPGWLRGAMMGAAEAVIAIMENETDRLRGEIENVAFAANQALEDASAYHKHIRPEQPRIPKSVTSALYAAYCLPLRLKEGRNNMDMARSET